MAVVTVKLIPRYQNTQSQHPCDSKTDSPVLKCTVTMSKAVVTVNVIRLYQAHYHKATGCRDCITDTPITKYSHKVNGCSNILPNYTLMLKYTVTKSLGVVTTKLLLYWNMQYKVLGCINCKTDTLVLKPSFIQYCYFKFPMTSFPRPSYCSARHSKSFYLNQIW